MRRELADFLAHVSGISKRNKGFLDGKTRDDMSGADLENLSRMIPADEAVLLIWTSIPGFLVLTPRRLLYYSRNDTINLPISAITQVRTHGARFRRIDESRLDVTARGDEHHFWLNLDGSSPLARMFHDTILQLQIALT